MAVPREGSFPPVELPPMSPSGAAQEQWGYLILLLRESTCWSCRLGHTDGNLHLNFLTSCLDSAGPRSRGQDGHWARSARNLCYGPGGGGRGEGGEEGWIQCCPKFSPATLQFSKSFLWEKSVLNNDQDSGRTGKHLEKSVLETPGKPSL